MIGSFFQGFGVSGGLIAAIGAQNSFVLSQGIRGHHHLAIALVCIFCDIIFITLGVAGVGSFLAGFTSFAQWITWGGASFLIFYGCCSFRSAIQGGSLENSNRAVGSLGAAIMMTLAVTLLNPHFYLDTVVLLGGISSQFYGVRRLWFWAGAVFASTLWFFCLSLGGRALAPIFKRPISWRILDTLVGITMWIIAGSLLSHGIPG